MSNGSEGIVDISQNSRTEASPSGGLISYQGHSLKSRGSYLSRDTVSVFYSPSRLGSLSSRDFFALCVCVCVCVFIH